MIIGLAMMTAQASFPPSAPTPTARILCTPSNCKAQASQVKPRSIGAQIRPFVSRCMPSGYAKADIVTNATLHLGHGGQLIDAQITAQTGVNDSNRKIADLHAKCVINAVRQASPFEGLPDENYEQWQSWQVSFRIR
jgi:hypothetical protein